MSLSVRLKQIRHEADGISSYELVAPEGGSLPPFTAGAHVDLQLPDGLVRSYSLVNAPSETHRYLIAVYRDEASRGGSSWMHQVPRVGDLLTISEPINHFPLTEDAANSIFIAGGIGITPIVAMASHLQELGRSWHLHYAARSPAQAAFADALGGLAAQSGAALNLHFSSQKPGRLDIETIVAEAPAGTHLYCCGPTGMIEDFLKACARLPPALVHVERFAATQEAATEGGYEVVLKRSQRSFKVEAGKTILDTLLDNGVDAMYACSQGVCGTCMTNVIEGVPDHRDEYLTDEEKAANKTIMICCSGSRSARLVLDL